MLNQTSSFYGVDGYSKRQVIEIRGKVNIVSRTIFLFKEAMIIKKYYIPILFVLIITLFSGSYFILRVDNISNFVVILLMLTLIFLSPVSIYWLWIRPRSMSKLFVYLSFVLCLGASYLIIPFTQKDFSDQILVWLLPVLEVSIIIVVVYSIAKTIIRYKANNNNKYNDFLKVMRISLEPKLGNGFILEAVLTELSVLYYSILVWFKNPSEELEGSYTYHKSSQIKMIVILFSILIAVEGAFFHFLIQRWSDIFAWIFTVLNIYALLYMMGLYNSVRFLPHFIRRDKLIIRLGFQSSIEIGIDNIESIKKARESEFGVRIPKNTYYSLLKIDTPEFELNLKEPTLMRGSYGRKKYVDTVIFRADEPKKMIEEIHSNLNFFDND